MVWLTGGALALCVAMVVGLVSLVVWKGAATFWPLPVDRFTTLDKGVYMGEITRQDSYRPEASAFEDLSPEAVTNAVALLARSGGIARRELIRTGNFRLTQNHFRWVDEFEIASRDRPAWAMVLERLEWGRFYGTLEAFLILHPVSSAKEAQTLVNSLNPQAGFQTHLVDRRLVEGVEQVVLLPATATATATATVIAIEEAQGLLAVALVANGPEVAWQAFQSHHQAIRERWLERRDLEKFDTGEVNYKQEEARLAVREAELDLVAAEKSQGEHSSAWKKAKARLEKQRAAYSVVEEWAHDEFDRIRRKIDLINEKNNRYQLLLRTAGEGSIPAQSTLVRLDEIVRAYPANRVSWSEKLSIYFSRWREFVVDEPREANSEGGVFPAIFGTVTMTLIMSLLVVPFGVLTALYLREYAKAGPLVTGVRIAVNNLAGVPSIVFGIFGLGFFCYLLGATLDEVLFSAHLPNPTYGKGGLLWASFTLALLTLPVVIVATEEAISAVPNSMREGSYACGASKWQTIQRIVLPRAMPGVITGMILAIARGAGEVAPLMLVGAVKLAPGLPVDGLFPYLHPERSFMHLGFHIYDVGFQSQNSEAAKPMVFTTTLLLIAIIAAFNFTTIWLRNRLRKRFSSGQF
jgi:phosphate transport system permease protein